MNTSVNFAGIKMKNPVTVSAGTFGYGREYSNFFDLNKLGGIITEGTSLKPKSGNKPPRICETPSGVLSNVGLQNPGIEYFIENEFPFLKKFDTAIIVNVCGSSINDFIEVCKILDKIDIDGIELNLACTDNENDGKLFGRSYESVRDITSKVRKVISKPLIIKLTPNVADITLSAKGAKDGGADGISLINTILGMKIDIEKRKPILGANMGGLSGPAIRPIAVRMVYQVAKEVDIPILGMGGITNAEDAIEFMLAGANAIAIGSSNFANPYTSIETISGIEKYMEKHNIENITEIVGKVTM